MALRQSNVVQLRLGSAVCCPVARVVALPFIRLNLSKPYCRSNSLSESLGGLITVVCGDSFRNRGINSGYKGLLMLKVVLLVEGNVVAFMLLVKLAD